MHNPDSHGQIFMPSSNAKKLGMTFGPDVYRSPTSTQTVTVTGTGSCSASVAALDMKWKENVKEVSDKYCCRVVNS